MSESTLITRRRLLQAGGAVMLLSLSRVGCAAAPTIVAVRVWPSSDYTRVTLESSEKLKFRSFTMQNPDRVVIDIEGVQLNAALRDVGNAILGDDPYIRAARAGQFDPNTVRLVLDVKAPVNPQVFTLPPVSEYRHRLVIDLYPTHSADPLLALLNDYNNGKIQNDVATPPPARDKDVAPSRQPDRGRREFLVMLDPGHGGEDPGAIGPSGAREKDVVLAIAKQLKRRIDATPGMRVMLTRDDDIFIPLGVRVAKARKANADLFISIHADAFTTPAANGSSVFTLSDKGATSTAAKWLAKTQNDADLIGGVRIDAGRDRYLAHTLLDLTQTATINDSMRLAKSVLGEIGDINRLHSGKVEQAGFAVLKAPDIPSILVETAFISNPAEEARLVTSSHQAKIADAILTGVKRYASRTNSIVARS